MEAHARSFRFIEKAGFVKIPFFQRPYVWEEENWEELLSDLLESEKKSLFGFVDT